MLWQPRLARHHVGPDLFLAAAFDIVCMAPACSACMLADLSTLARLRSAVFDLICLMTRLQYLIGFACLCGNLYRLQVSFQRAGRRAGAGPGDGDGRQFLIHPCTAPVAAPCTARCLQPSGIAGCQPVEHLGHMQSAGDTVLLAYISCGAGWWCCAWQARRLRRLRVSSHCALFHHQPLTAARLCTRVCVGRGFGTFSLNGTSMCVCCYPGACGMGWVGGSAAAGRFQQLRHVWCGEWLAG